MGYCSLGDIEKVLAQTLTSASTQTSVTGLPGNLTAIGKKLKLNLITEDDANYYIRLADAHINAALSQQYVTPVKETCGWETILTSDMDEYSDTITVKDASLFVPGDILYITDGTFSERVEVLEVVDNVVTTREVVVNLYFAEDTRVMQLRYPDPIPFISARLAAATIYDKYAKAQQEPSKSEFSDLLRSQAIAELDNIREGRTILFGVQRRGWRFANPNLLDRYPLRAPFDTDGTRSAGNK